MNRLLCGLVLTAAFAFTSGVANAGNETGDLPALKIPDRLKSAVPLPMAEADLPSVVAREYFKVSEKALQLECPTFDKQGDLIFCEVFGGTVFRLTPDKKLSSVVPDPELRPAGLAVHKSGRIYMAELGDFASRGSVISMAPDGTDLQQLVSREMGFLPDWRRSARYTASGRRHPTMSTSRRQIEPLIRKTAPRGPKKLRACI